MLVIFASFNLIDNAQEAPGNSYSYCRKKCMYVFQINVQRAVFDKGLVFLEWYEKNASSNTINVWIILFETERILSERMRVVL